MWLFSRLLVHSTNSKRILTCFTRLLIWISQSSSTRAVKANTQVMLQLWLNFCQPLIQKIQWVQDSKQSYQDKQLVKSNIKMMVKKFQKMMLVILWIKVNLHFAFTFWLIEVALCQEIELSLRKMPWNCSCQVCHQTAYSKLSALVRIINF